MKTYIYQARPPLATRHAVVTVCAPDRDTAARLMSERLQVIGISSLILRAADILPSEPGQFNIFYGDGGRDTYYPRVLAYKGGNNE